MCSAELLIRDILEHGKNWEHADHVIASPDVRAAWDMCVDELETRRSEAFSIFKQRALAAAQRKRNHLENFLARKEETLNRAINTLKERDAPASQLRGFQTRLTNLRQDFGAKINKAERGFAVSDEFKEVSGLVCRVRG